MDKDEYFFYEWIILQKKLTEEQFKKLSDSEFQELKKEYLVFCNNLK